MRAWIPGWGGGGFPWDSGHNMFNHGGKYLAVLINIKTFLVCQGMLGDVVCGFRTCCMLLDTSWRICWLVAIGSDKGIILFVFFGKNEVSWRSSTENASVIRRVASSGFFGTIPR